MHYKSEEYVFKIHSVIFEIKVGANIKISATECFGVCEVSNH